MALKYDKAERSYELPYEEAEITEEDRASSKREDIEKCLKAGVLPKIYEGTGISVEVQTKGAISCFLRDEDGHVICPMGHELRYSRKRGKCMIYRTGSDAGPVRTNAQTRSGKRSASARRPTVYR